MRRAALLFLILAAVSAAQKRPFDADALMQIARISDPSISPDGRAIAFTVDRADIAQNRRIKNIFTVAVAGGLPRQLTQAGNINQRARWSPDSKHITFISDRGSSSQVWIMDADGNNPKQITNIATEADNVLFSPDGKSLVFTSDVFPDCPDETCNSRRLDTEKNDKVKARIYTGLLYRHWNKWDARRRSHLMTVLVSGGAVKDLTPGDRDVPPFSLGGPDDFTISPDGAEVCYAMNADEVPAVSTNSDLYVVPIAGGKPQKITTNPGADSGPQYSPDGKYLAYRSQARGGYESDRWRLMVLERASGKLVSLTENLDRWVSSFTWFPDSSRVFFTAEDRGRQPIQFISVNGGPIRVAASGDNYLDDVQFTPDGRTMIYTANSGSSPPEIYRAASSGGVPVPLTGLNDSVFNEHAVAPLEEFWIEGAEKGRVQSFLVKPFGFDSSKRYPALMLIHGGPQGAWGESWTNRWNAQAFAAAGYVVVMPNPRGSTGYGQKFIDDINGDWGGKAYDDLMAVTDHVSALRYVDKNRIAAAGGSYGGYMVNWILGHGTRFRCLVSHAGVYDLRSMFGETEELWFPLWEFDGAPWDNPEMYVRWSPSQFAKEFRTPTLVIHGEQDYRVPYGQGLQLYTALQLQKVPSKLLLFPDEGHWINKPQNSLLWYKTFIDWIDSWTKR
jgi:dipeptidyl aminopeptidase/acylaminoacyl peptidase